MVKHPERAYNALATPSLTLNIIRTKKLLRSEEIRNQSLGFSDWGFGFGVEGFEVGWTSIHPNQDAAGGLFVRRHARRRGLAQLQQVRETAAG